MTVANAYITSDDLMRAKGIDDYYDSDLADAARSAASRYIDDKCGRRFYADAGVSAKQYTPPEQPDRILFVDDFQSASGLIVSDRGNTLTIDVGFQIEPKNIIGAQTAYPYTGIRPLSWYWLEPIYPGQFTITVTALWGWAAVPEPIKRATLMAASDIYNSKDNRFGTAGFGEFGVVRIRTNQMIEELIRPYKRADQAPGFGIA